MLGSAESPAHKATEATCGVYRFLGRDTFLGPRLCVGGEMDLVAASRKGLRDPPEGKKDAGWEQFHDSCKRDGHVCLH